jgi:hypothetical protein
MVLRAREGAGIRPNVSFVFVVDGERGENRSGEIPETLSPAISIGRTDSAFLFLSAPTFSTRVKNVSKF